jgi:hypothetical protein
VNSIKLTPSLRYGVRLLVLLALGLVAACGPVASPPTELPATSAPTTSPTQTAAPTISPTISLTIEPPTATEVSPTGTATSFSETPTAISNSSVFTGSVLIEGGQSMTGGVIGQTITMTVTFTAHSTAGEVKEMRVNRGGGCASESAIASSTWEPFAAQKAYATTAPMAIVGWYASAQYRDDKGNVSPVYCDDISVEGMPPAPTP